MQKCGYDFYSGFVSAKHDLNSTNLSKTKIINELKDLYQSLSKPSHLDLIHAMNYSIKIDCDNRSEHLYMVDTKEGPNSFKLCKPKGECDFYENIEPSALCQIFYEEANKMVDSFL